MLAKCFENLVLASAQNNQVQVAEEYGTLTQDQIGLASSAQAVNPVRGDVGNPDPYMMGQGNMLMTGTLVQCPYIPILRLLSSTIHSCVQLIFALTSTSTT